MKMNLKNRLILLALSAGLLLLSACVKHADSGRIDQDNARSEAEIEVYLSSLLEGAYSMSFELELVAKVPMELTQYSMIDTSRVGTYVVDGAHEYQYRVTDANGKTGELSYFDPIIERLNDTETPEKEWYRGEYRDDMLDYEFKVETERLMDNLGVIGKIDDLQTYNSGITFVFACSDDSRKVGELYQELTYGSLGRFSLSDLVVTKDKAIFDVLSKEQVELSTLSQDEITIGETVYSVTLITEENGYLAETFEQNGNPEDEHYQSAENFDTILFAYISYLRVYGLKKIA